MRHFLQDTRHMAVLSMLCALLLVMGMTGIGFIPLPVIKATTMHIPVILGAVLLGPEAGGILGGLFGLCSIWVNTTTPSLLSFAFSPFMSTEGLVGVVKSLWISLGCRILFGVLAAYIWKFACKWSKKEYVTLSITAALASLLHTILVMGSIYLLLAQQYAMAKNTALTAVFGLVMGTITASGIPEAIVAAILVSILGKVLIKLMANIKNK